MLLTRRWFLGGAASLLAAPAIVRVESLMPVKVFRAPLHGISPGMAALRAQREAFYKLWEETAELLIYPPAGVGPEMEAQLRATLEICEKHRDHPRYYCGAEQIA